MIATSPGGRYPIFFRSALLTNILIITGLVALAVLIADEYSYEWIQTKTTYAGNIYQKT